MTASILIVEDESDISNILDKYLTHHGFQTHIIDDGGAVEPWLENNEPNLILLDRMLPNRDGVSICKNIRDNDNQVPIIMITALHEEDDRLLGFEVGADDYVTKPFSAKEVVARVQSVLRRYNASPQNELIRMDENALKLYISGVDLQLTSVEFNLFKLMHSNPDKIYNRQDIMQLVYQDYRVVSDRSIDSHIKNLRKKLDDTELTGQCIKTIYGRGYSYHV